MKRKRKIHAGSLAAKLTEEQREHLLYELIVKGRSYEEAVGICGDWQVSTSESSLFRFLESEGPSWSSERADMQAEELSKSQPKNLEEKIQRGLKQKLFEKVYSDLSVKEMYALTRAQIAYMRTQNDSRRVAILEKRLVEMQGVISKAAAEGGFTKETLEEAQAALNLL